MTPPLPTPECDADMPQLLVVDDQPINIQTIYQLFEDEYDVAMATSGAEALAFCQERLPDLILLDVLMPDMGGYEVCRRLKDDPRTRDIPIIFVTVQSDPLDEAEGLERGAVDYITKPIVDIVVKARVRTHLALRRAVRDLARSQEELNQAEQMLALGKIVAGVAHELSTPLGNALVTATTLQSESTALRKELAEGHLRKSAVEEHFKRSDECLALILRSLWRAGDLIGTFKQVAVADTGETRHAFQLDELVADIVGAMSLSLEPQNVRCVVAVDPGLEMDSFPGALGKVLMGLIQNAQLHAYPGSPGEIRITGQLGESHPFAPATVTLRIEDQGRGIASENLKRIFDPFYSTQIGRGGPGLGLSITRALISQVLGGKIMAESTVGQGTRFLITLPLKAPELKQAPIAPS